jgi:hypothetical protein
LSAARLIALLLLALWILILLITILVRHRHLLQNSFSYPLPTRVMPPGCH